jgi:PadR family transcriptional regulator, regulatory protein PadR
MRQDTQLVKGTVRLLILRLLEGEPMYGYQMIQHLRDRSEGYFQLGEGALYPLLHEMEGEGFLRAEWQAQENRPPRCYYYLTTKGNKELARRVKHWQGFTKAVNLVMEASHV